MITGVAVLPMLVLLAAVGALVADIVFMVRRSRKRRESAKPGAPDHQS